MIFLKSLYYQEFLKRLISSIIILIIFFCIIFEIPNYSEQSIIPLTRNEQLNPELPSFLKTQINKFNVSINSILTILVKIINKTNVVQINSVANIPIQSDNKIDYLMKKEQVSPILAMHLVIPKINVNALIKSVGIKANWEMDVAKNPDDVGWFNLWPSPWMNGSSVIAGHYWIRKNGKISVFNQLNKLEKGDKLYIENTNGEIINFVVNDIKIYDKDADASDVFESNDWKAHLNLITCIYDSISKTYPSRLVVFTNKE